MKKLVEGVSNVRVAVYNLSISISIVGFLIMVTTDDMSDSFAVTLIVGLLTMLIGAVSATISNYPVPLIAFMLTLKCISTYKLSRILHIELKNYRTCRSIIKKYDKSIIRLYQASYAVIRDNSNILPILHV